MARLPFWTRVGRRLRRMWRARFRRVLRTSTRRSPSKNRHRSLGSRRYRIKSIDVTGARTRRRYQHRGPNYVFFELFAVTLLCAIVFPFDLIRSVLNGISKKKKGASAHHAYCDQQVVGRLQVGTYLDLQREPDNLHDKEAIALLWHGAKGGYIAHQDRLPYATCLKLKRNVYAVVTDIMTKDGRKIFEYETWYDHSSS